MDIEVYMREREGGKERERERKRERKREREGERNRETDRERPVFQSFMLVLILLFQPHLQAMSKESTSCPPEPMDSEDMLFMLYTSGSTGKPKGIVHTQAGYLLYAALTQQVRRINTLMAT